MQQQEFLQLIDKYLLGQTTPEEEELLIRHFESFQKKKDEEENEDKDQEWDERILGIKQQLADKMLANIQQAIKTRTDQSNRAKVVRLPGRRFRNIAAALLAFAFIGGVLFYHRPNKTTQQAPVAIAKTPPKNDVEPGKNKAILTLSNGTKMVLDSAQNGLLVSRGGIDIKKTKEGQLIYLVDKNGRAQQDSGLTFSTISTPRGGQYQVVLSDGTKVWINAESVLKFPTAFTGHDRTVELTGEAYFEVAKNASKPFYIKVNGIGNDMQVQVLGTNFNVMAYGDEPAIKTTLLEGSVRLTQGSNSKVLQPHQQAIVNHRGMQIVDVETDEAIAWKNGYFEFNRSNIRDIMKQLSRWYDTEVVYESKVPDDEFVGKISREATLSQVLHILELSHVHFRIENRKIIVTP